MLAAQNYEGPDFFFSNMGDTTPCWCAEENNSVGGNIDNEELRR